MAKKAMFDARGLTFTGGLILSLSVVGLAWLRMKALTTKVDLMAERQGKIAIELAKVSQQYKTMELTLDEILTPLPPNDPPVVYVGEDISDEEGRPA